MEKAIEMGADGSRVRLLRHGVERAADSTEAPARLDFGERYALYAGRLSAEKGVRLLPSLAMRLAPVPVMVAGAGPLAGWLSTQASTVGNLRLLGHRDAVELRALLAGAAAVLVPSLFYETFCYAAAEALLEARPVVASRLGAIPELVEHEVTGLLVPPGDAHALAEAVHRALEEPMARAWAIEGHNRVERLGEPWSHVAGLVSIYREAIAG
jgi:glycosyltransferase involved in cell wall biosynthesis